MAGADRCMLAPRLHGVGTPADARVALLPCIPQTGENVRRQAWPETQMHCLAAQEWCLISFYIAVLATDPFIVRLPRRPCPPLIGRLAHTR